MIVIVLIAVVRDVLLLPGCGPHHVHHHRLQQPPGVQPPAGPRTQPLFRGGFVDRSSLIFDIIIQQRDFAASCWAFTSILGCSLGGALSDLLGRRVVIMVTSL